MSKAKEKQVMIVARANGSAKTTFAKQMSPEDPSKARIAAGKKVIKSINSLIHDGRNFVIESTLSGSFLDKYIDLLKENHYKVYLTYIYLDSPSLCIERIKSRVMLGGHYIPDEDVIRRYSRSLINFWNNYRLKSDYFSLIVNNEYFDFKQVVNPPKHKTPKLPSLII
jgi:predicted ABC-type ATPase